MKDWYSTIYKACIYAGMVSFIIGFFTESNVSLFVATDQSIPCGIVSGVGEIVGATVVLSDFLQAFVVNINITAIAALSRIVIFFIVYFL